MINLPLWVLPEKFPSVYESESATALEMTSKLYGSMRDLVDDYNSFVKRVETLANQFEEGTNKDVETFKVALRQEFQDFIDVVELKLMSQDRNITKATNEQNKRINESIEYIRVHLSETINNTIEQMRENGELYEDVLGAFEEVKDFISTYRLNLIYDEVNESLLVTLTSDTTAFDKELVSEYNSETEDLTFTLE